MITALEILILSNLKCITLHHWRSSRSLVGARVIVLVLGFSLMTDRRAISDDDVRWNQIQVIGTHNSYHLAPLPAVRSLIAAAGERQAEALGYSHPPLAEQFSAQGVRQIELDVFHDPERGRYAETAARKIIRGMGRDPGPDPASNGMLHRPGMKVLHVPDVDYRTNAPTLVDALKQVRNWSRAHPKHVPIMIMLELKKNSEAVLPTKPLPFDRKALETLEAEILSVFPRVDDHLGRGPSLRRAEPGAGGAGGPGGRLGLVERAGMASGGSVPLPRRSPGARPALATDR